MLTLTKKLKKGDTISIVAPSSGLAYFAVHRIEIAKKVLEKMGFLVIIENNALKNIGYLSGLASERVADIHSAFSNKNVKAIFCTIGGNHSNQLLKYIDFDLVRNNPKIFVGYSDISVLHYAFLKKSGLQTYYGPCLMTQFGEFPEPLPYTYDYFKKVLITDNNEDIDVLPSESFTDEVLNWVTKSDLERPRKMIDSIGYKWLRDGYADSEIIGGCIPSINHLVGTDFWIDPKDKIFFIDIPEGHNLGEGLSISELDSYLADLDNIGVFKSIKGLIVGRPFNYNKEQHNELILIINYYTKDTNYPILFNANIGHSDPIITLPMMSRVILDSKNNKFIIKR